MEYRRRRGSKRRRKPSGTAGSGGKAVIVVILLAAAVYLVSISAIGSWLSKHVVDPVISAFSKNEHTDEPALSDDNGSIYTVNTTVELDLPALKCYAIQMGAFSAESGANELAEQVREQGGGGYIYYDGEKYRVLAAGYSTEEDARIVKERLMADGQECSVHELSTAGSKFDMSIVSGTDATAAEMQSAIYAVLSAHDDLIDLERTFSEGGMTAEDGAKAAQVIYNELSAGITDKAALPQEFITCVDTCLEAVTELIAGSNMGEREFSSLIKRTQLNVACEFTQTINALIKE